MKINVRKILKKIAAVGFSAVAVAATAGTAMIPDKKDTVQAESGPWVAQDNNAKTDFTTDVSGEGGFVHFLGIDNGVGTAFCVENQAQSGHFYSTREKVTDFHGHPEVLAYAYYGSAGAPKGKEDVYYAAAQCLLWASTDTILYGHPYNESGYTVTGAHHQEVEDAKADIKNKYAEDSKNGTTYEGYVYEGTMRGGAHGQNRLAGVARKPKDLTVSAHVTKVSKNDTSKGLAGAKFRFQLFKNSDRNTILNDVTQTTDGDGHTNHDFTITNPPDGATGADYTFRVTEVEAPPGYDLATPSSQEIPASGPGNVAEFTFADPTSSVDVSGTIHKQSSNPSLTNGNPNYSLAGAVFAVTVNGPGLNNWDGGTVTTDQNGNATFTHTFTGLSETGTPDQYKVSFKETSASKGFKVNGNTYTVPSGDTQNVPETPIYDPVSLQITKRAMDGSKVKNPKPLTGAVFTLRYYAVDPNTASVSGTPTRTWTVSPTRAQSNGNYRGDLDDATGDPLYRDSDNRTVLPLGILTIEETKAPDGYSKRNRFIDVNGHEVTKNSDGIVTLRIRDQGSTSDATIDYGHALSVEDDEIRGGFNLVKYDQDLNTNQQQGDAQNLSAEFQVINKNDYDVVSRDADGREIVAAKNEAAYTFTSNADGSKQTNLDLLPAGKYTLVETKGPTGYTLNGKTSQDFEITTDGQNVNLVGTIKDTPIRGGFKIQKHDAETKKTEAQGDAKIGPVSYKVVNKSTHPVVVNNQKYDVNATVFTFKTNENGYYESAGDLLPYGTYLIQETDNGAPTGYRSDAESSLPGVSVQIRDNGKRVDASAYDYVKRGGFTFQKHDAETNLTTPQGDAAIGPADYAVYNASDHSVVVNGTEYAKNAVVFTFTTNEKGFYQSPKDLLPYGTYILKETKEPNGHKLDSTAAEGITLRIRNDHETVETNASNNPKRGTFKMTKRDFTDLSKNPEGNASLIGGTYTVTNKSVHPVLVDKNGDGKRDVNTELFAPGQVVYQFTTSDQNVVDGVFTAPDKLLPYGSYTLKEVKAPEGYQDIDSNGARLSVDFSIRNDGETVDLTGKDKIANTPQRGTFKVKKNDLYLGTNTAQGDNNLSGEYALINKSKHAVYVDTDADGEIDLKNEKFEPGEVIRDRAKDNSLLKKQYSFVTAADGTFSWPTPKNGDPSYWQGLPYGHYDIEEVQAPANYTKVGNTLISFDIDKDGAYVDRTKDLDFDRATHVSEKASKETFANEATYGKIEVYKHANKQSGSEDDDVYEDNAKFLVILTSKLKSLYGGKIKDAWTALENKNGQNIVDKDNNVILSSHEFSIITTGTETDADGDVMHGYGLSGDLATGKYSIMQFRSGEAKGYNPVDLNMKDEVKDNVEVTSKETTVVETGYKEWNNWKNPVKNRLSVTNDEKVYNLRIIKEDEATGKTVTLNSASFMVYADTDGDGKLTAADLKYNSIKDNGDIDYKFYQKDMGVTKIVNGVVTMTGSDGKDYDVFRTLSDNVGDVPAGTFVISNTNASKIDKGSAVQPLTLKKGTYFIVEKDKVSQAHATPKGYTAELTSVNGDIEGNEDTFVGKMDDGTSYLRFKVDGTQYTVNHESGSDAKQIESSTQENKDQNIISKVFSWFNHGTSWVSGTKRLDLDDDYYVTQKAANQRVFGRLIVNKTIEPKPEGVDKSLVDDVRKDMSGIQFTLYAAEDIIDPADGSIITKKGDIARVYNSDTRDYTDFGIYNCDKNGHIDTGEQGNIPLGKYVLKETKVPKGIVLQGDKSWDAVFEQPENDRKIATVNQEFSIENFTTKVKISKVNVTGEEEVPGATIEILDERGNVVSDDEGKPLTWVSTDKPYFIEGLGVGKYQLKETIAPEGYVLKTSTVPFEIKNTGEIQKAAMKDKTVTLKKVDADGKVVDGAELTVYELDNSGQHIQVENEEGKLVDKVVDVLKYTSEDQNGFKVKNLETGKKYEVVETVTPKGFVELKPYQFEVKDDDKDQIETVKNKHVTVSKEDVGGKEVPGAVLTITDKDGNVVDQWTSTEETHYAENLKVGETYTLHEDTAPAGFVTATDITFTVKDDGIDQKVTMVDKTVTVKKIDMDKNPVIGAELTVYGLDQGGNRIKTDDGSDKVVYSWTVTDKDADGVKVENLVVGHTYQIVETKTPAGFLTIKPYNFTVKDDNKDQTETLVDKRVIVSKQDVGGEEVPGAIMSITDKDGKIVDQWTSSDKPHYAANLQTGETYTLHENTAPAGYVKATDVEFTVKDDGVDQKIKMIDKILTTKKVDMKKKPVAGAELTIYEIEDDGTAKAVFTWKVSDKDTNGVRVSNLTAGKSYRVVETKTPSGYVTFKPYEFTVKNDNKNQTETIVDKRVEISKEDVGGKEVPGAVLTITDKDGKVVDKWTSTDKTHYASGLQAGETYTLHEDTTPLGYVKANDITFTVTDNGVDQKVTMVDKIVTVLKTDMCGKPAVGAQLTVYELGKDNTPVKDIVGLNKVVYQWTVTDKDTGGVKVNNLEIGKTYQIVETKTPAGFVTVKPYTFTVTDDNKDQKETIVDKRVEVSKEDVGGKELPGAILTITDKDGKIVDRWTSTTETHYVDNLKSGESYVLHEDTAPLGYVKATDIPFTVTDDGVDQKVTMIDVIEKFAKYDNEGNLLKGAELEVVDDHGEVVDKWISGQHIVDLTDTEKITLGGGKEITVTLEDGTTVRVVPLHETDTKSVKDGRYDESGKAIKDKACEYLADTGKKNNSSAPEISESTKITGYEAVITKTDGSISYKMIDLNGDETEHMISGLTSDSKYTVKEVHATDGYYFDQDVVITPASDKDGSASMTDSKTDYEIVKVDENGKNVKGVTLKLTDVTDQAHPEVVSGVEGQTTDKDGNAVWITTDKPIKLVGVLKADHYYELEETEIVAGVWKATNVNFRVSHTGDGKPVTITMVDQNTHVSVLKTDDHGTPLKGAKMSIYETTKDESGKTVKGNLVYTFTSTDSKNGTDISKYVKGGETYIIEEDEAPFGFNRITAQEFTVTGKSTTAQVVVLHDERKPYTVELVKTDATNKKPVAGATLGLFYEDGTEVTTSNGRKAEAVTSASGTVRFKVLYSDDLKGKKIYAKEIKAPTGYQASTKHYNVRVRKAADFDKDVAVRIEIPNTPIHNTGISAPVAYAAIGLGAALVIVLLMVNDRKLKKSE